MASKRSFTPEEWTKVLESVTLAGVAVTAAEPSGLWGTLKEGFASASDIGRTESESTPHPTKGASSYTVLWPEPCYGSVFTRLRLRDAELLGIEAFAEGAI